MGCNLRPARKAIRIEDGAPKEAKKLADQQKVWCRDLSETRGMLRATCHHMFTDLQQITEATESGGVDLRGPRVSYFRSHPRASRSRLPFLNEIRVSGLEGL